MVTLAKISVLMPVFNAEAFLAAAIDSVLSQTFGDFEFLILDDASSDGSRDILADYQRRDSRIKVLLSERNKGIAETLNEGIKVCRGEYIARMDADDLSLPQRFERQVKFMDRSPKVGVCGTWFTAFGQEEGDYRHPVGNDDIKLHHLLRDSAIGHPTVFMRRCVLEATGVTYPDVAAHDLWFWIKLGFVTQLRNLPEVLLHYRVHGDQYSRLSNSPQQLSAAEAREYFAGEILNRTLTEQEKSAHRALSGRTDIASAAEFERVCSYAAELGVANEATRLIGEAALATALSQSVRRLPLKYAESHYKYCAKYDLGLLCASLRDPLRPLPSLGPGESLRFIVKCVVGHIPRALSR
jgi:glycosyltransferase involved in cell wall biosynthesis